MSDSEKPPELRDTGMILFGLPVYENSDPNAPPIQLGTCADGVTFTPAKQSEPREPITISGKVLSFEAALEIPDESPIWRWPACMAANARNN